MEQRFEVVVTSTDNHTWQGTLRGGGEDFHFQSEVQLLLEMATAFTRRAACVPHGKRRNAHDCFDL